MKVSVLMEKLKRPSGVCEVSAENQVRLQTVKKYAEIPYQKPHIAVKPYRAWGLKLDEKR